MKSVITHIYIYLFSYRLHIMSGSCKHQKRCGLSWLRLLYIFVNKIYFLKYFLKILDNLPSSDHLQYNYVMLEFDCEPMWCPPRVNIRSIVLLNLHQ